MKSKFCVAGNKMLYEYGNNHSINYKKCGKLIVSTIEKEVPQLDIIKHNAEANGIKYCIYGFSLTLTLSAFLIFMNEFINALCNVIVITVSLSTLSPSRLLA